MLPLLMLACGPKDEDGDGIEDGIRKPDSVSVVAPSTPIGTVSGQVLNTRMEPLADASIRLLIGSDTPDTKYSVRTDASGNFMIKGVPAGSATLVTVSKEGFATLRASATVPSTAGNIPINNGNASLGVVMLSETRTPLRFTLLTDSGKPAAGAQAYLEAYPAGLIAAAGTTSTATSSVMAIPAVADAAGVVTFNNMPSPSELTRIGTALGSTSTEGTAVYRLWVDPVDLNGDGVLDSGGYTGQIKAATLLTSGPQIVTLGSARNDNTSTAFTLLSTNVPSLKTGATTTEDAKKPLRNMLRPGEPIYLGFSQPVAPDSLIAVLTNEFAQTPIELTIARQGVGDVYTLTPAVANILEGQKYNLVVRATSAYSAASLVWKGFFISGDTKTPRPLQIASVTFKDGASGTAGTLDAGECIIVTFNQVVAAPSLPPDAIVVVAGVETKNMKNLASAPFPMPVALPCFADEPSAKIPIDTTISRATSRYYFSYGNSGDTAAVTPPINPGLALIRLNFSPFLPREFSLYYESAWGAPVAASTVLEAPLTR
ncbi:MAG: carboxypeptidase-like regulatory domain-containing protein [Cystobacter sp.]